MIKRYDAEGAMVAHREGDWYRADDADAEAEIPAYIDGLEATIEMSPPLKKGQMEGESE